MQIMITLNQIREQGPCASGWEKLLASKGKTAADDKPFPLTDVLDSNGLDDTLWCLRCLPEHNRLWRQLACDYAETVRHLMPAQLSTATLDVARRHAEGLATDEELAAATDAAKTAWAAWVAAGAVRDADLPARAAAWAARAAAWAASDALGDSMGHAELLREYLTTGSRSVRG
jgi:hypothetical protein